MIRKKEKNEEDRKMNEERKRTRRRRMWAKFFFGLSRFFFSWQNFLGQISLFLIIKN